MRQKQKKPSGALIVDDQFESFYRRNYPHMLLLAELLLKKNLPENTAREFAVDATQETFIVAWKKWKTVSTHPKPEAWLYEVLRYKVLQIVRDEWTWHKRTLQLSNTAESSAFTSADTFTLRTELQDMLTEEEYSLLVQLYLEGKTFDALSQELGMNRSALAMRVTRIKKRLRKKFFSDE